MALHLLHEPVRSLVEPVAAGRVRGPCVFDADGTLWPSDVGEEFLRWLEAEGRLPGMPSGGAWERYSELFLEDAQAAFAFAVEAMAGIREADLVAWALPFVRLRFVPNVFPPMREILAALRASGQDVWVVSASCQWLVRPAAVELGLDPTHVVAIDAEVIDGRLTARVKRPLPAGPGKAEALRRAGLRPVLAAGNSPYDESMLAMAARAFVVVPRSAPEGAGALMAAAHGWPVLWV